jgi:PAS domain S-box-containing protein
MFKKEEHRESIRYKFVKDISVILLISTIVLTTVIALNERSMLKGSLMAKGRSFAAYIAKLSIDPLVMRDNIQLDSIVNEANKDADIIYTLVKDAQGNIITSQFASINYQSPVLKNVLSGLSKESEFSDILSAIDTNESFSKLSVPILTGGDTIGSVTICISQYNIRKQILKTVLFVIALNLVITLVLGAVLFITSRKTILDPISELGYAAERLAKGDLSTQVKIQAAGEVGMLVDSFNKMAGDLEKTTVSRDYVDDIIGTMRDTLIVTSRDGTITRVNMAACFLLGYHEAELLGQPVSRVLMDEPGEKIPLLHRVVDASSINAIERTYLAKSGKKVPVLFSASVMRDLSGEVRSIVCMAQDMSDRKRYEEKLKTYSEELGEINEELKNFAYIVSHDLRAPLVNIKGFSDELERALREIGPCFQKHFTLLDQTDREKLGPVLQTDIPQALTFISSSVSRMDSIINSVLKLSRAGRRKIMPEPVIVKELVQTVVNSLAHQIGSRSVAVTVRDLPDVVTDRTALEQIFGNLLDNAVKYLDTGRAGEIEISAEQNSPEVVFHVRDNGRGMAKEDIPRAFEIFRRVGAQDVPGEGMGLAYVKTVVRLLGGRIWCESEPGAGTTFSFSLPVNVEVNGMPLSTGGQS